MLYPSDKPSFWHDHLEGLCVRPTLELSVFQMVNQMAYVPDDSCADGDWQ